MYILQSDNLTFTAENVKDRVDYLQQINPDGDLILGTCGMAQLTFNVYDLKKILLDTEITGKTFVYSKSNSKISLSRWQDFRIIKPFLMSINNTYKYCAFNSFPYFLLYNGETQLTTPVQPIEPVTCIYINEDKVYLGHENADYMSVYSLTGTKLDNFILSEFNKTKIIKERALNQQGNTVKEYFINKYDLQPVEFIEQTVTYKQEGIFTANKPTRNNDSNILVVAYDNMFKFDKVIDSWANSIIYPITAYNLLISLCNYCNVTLATTSITNGDYSIIKKFQLDNTTGRAVLQWICELSANISYIDKLGALHVEFYKQTTTKFLPQHYSKTRQKEFITAKIDKVQVKVMDNDIGVIVPISEVKTNAYIIENNPLMYTSSDGALRPYVTNIYNKIKDFSYIPFEFDTVLNNNFTANIGDVISVELKSGEIIKSVVMVKHIVGEIETYISTGNITRATHSNSLNQAITMLNGRTSQLINTIDEYSVILTEVKSETETNTTQLTLTQGEILLKVDSAGIISAINMSPEGITIDSSKLDITGVVTFNDLLTPGKTIINGGILETCTIKWNNGDAEIGTNSDPSMGVTDTYINTPTGLMTINAGSTQITSDLDIIGKIYAPYSELDNASVGYLEMNGKSIYLATDGTVRWQGGEKLETTSVKISVTSTDGFILTGLNCIVNGNENPLHGTKSVVNLHYAVGTVLEVSFSSKTGYNTPDSFSYTVTGEAKVFAITYTKEGDPVIPETDAKYFEFNIGAQTITRFNKTLALADGITQVRIPSHINGVEVVKTGTSIFKENNFITAVELPNGIELGAYIFWDCIELIYCKLPNDLKIIPYLCFRNCKNLTKINIPETATSIEGYAFFFCEKFTEVNIPNSVKTIALWAFAQCYDMKIVNIGDGIETIGEAAFKYCADITININRPANSVAGAPWGATNATINWLG